MSVCLESRDGSSRNFEGPGFGALNVLWRHVSCEAKSRLRLSRLSIKFALSPLMSSRDIQCMPYATLPASTTSMGACTSRKPARNEALSMPPRRFKLTSPGDIDWGKVESYQRWAPTLLTIPQSNISLPPRPEFPVFVVPYLCASSPYDGGDFATYPERHGWIVHHHDPLCHGSHCPPGLCVASLEGEDLGAKEAHYRAYRPVSPMLSRTDGSPVTSASKASFLQSWLFFGALHEVSRMCNCPIDVQAEFVVDGGRHVSTAALNGLAARWFASLDSRSVGSTVFMDRILAIARRMVLLLNEEVTDEGEDRHPVFNYRPHEARVLFSITILFRVLALHLALHNSSPTSTYTEDHGLEGLWITGLLNRRGVRIEGMQDLIWSEELEVGTRQWCKSERWSLQVAGPADLFCFVPTIGRPLPRDHSACETICNAYQVDEIIYKAVHTETCPGETCSMGSVRAADLVERLIDGQIPVIVITEDLELQVVSNEDHPYIAFSHVCEWVY